MVVVYEIPGADEEANEWSSGEVDCECGATFTAAYHVPTYLKEGRLRCPYCKQKAAKVEEDPGPAWERGKH